MGRKRRDAGKERYWRRLVREQTRSKQPVRAFCEARGLAENSFYFWRRELQRRDAEQRTADPAAASPTSASGCVASAARDRRSAVAPPAFAEVTLGGTLPEPGSPAMEVLFADGVRVRVPSGFDAQTLREVLAAVRGAAC